jgi:hypothetical protein
VKVSLIERLDGALAPNIIGPPASVFAFEEAATDPGALSVCIKSRNNIPKVVLPELRRERHASRRYRRFAAPHLNIKYNFAPT